MEKFDQKQYAGVPEVFKKDGVTAHYGELVRVGDTVEAIRDVKDGEIPRGTQAKIIEIVVEPHQAKRGFLKRIKLEGYEGEYNPQRFKKL